MTIDEARAKYPALMSYIEARSALGGMAKWDQLHADEAEALEGRMADVATQLAQAQADYGSYPYNSAMGEFLGLPLRDNHEPAHGYYMANQIMSYHAMGEARREAERLIAEGKPLRVVAAKSKATGKGCRFHVFQGPEQIRVDGGAIVVNNGKRKGTLTSNWSVETAVVKLVAALRSGAAYGEA